MIKILNNYITITTDNGCEYDIYIPTLDKLDWPSHMRSKLWWTQELDAELIRVIDWIQNETYNFSS